MNNNKTRKMRKHLSKRRHTVRERKRAGERDHLVTSKEIDTDTFMKCANRHVLETDS